MRRRLRLGLSLWLALPWALPAMAASDGLHIVAAENFYGDIAAQLAGPAAKVVSVLRNPNSDPHLFEPDISTARAISAADLVIYNGLNYDPWMVKLLASAQSTRRGVIEAAAVLHRNGSGINPHLWYDPAAMPALARAIVWQLQQLDPAHSLLYQQRLTQFLQSVVPIDTEINRLRQRFAGTLVAATEPVADYLISALGLHTTNQAFQRAVMNDTEPSASDTAAVEQSLRERRVHVLIYNGQVVDTAVQRLLSIAHTARVPVVGVTETEPAGKDYQHWMLDQLHALDVALSESFA